METIMGQHRTQLKQKLHAEMTKNTNNKTKTQITRRPNTKNRRQTTITRRNTQPHRHSIYRKGNGIVK
jgi:hypothetical protein